MSTTPSITTATGHQTWAKVRPFAAVFLVAVAVAPVATVLHELGHYTAHLALGYQDVPFISYDSSATGTAPDDPRGIIDGLSSAAGPVVSLLLVWVGVVVARRGGPAPLALGLVAVDCFRVVGSLMVNGILEGDSPLDGLGDGFSELSVIPYHLDAMWAAVLVSLVDLALPLAAAVVVYRVLQRRGVRTVGATFGLAFAGVVAGMVLWLGALGPVVLP